MPLAVQNEIYEELKKKALGDQAPTQSDARSGDSQWPIIEEVADVPYLLCVLLLEGLGGTQNLEGAVTWLIASANAGCQRARLDLPRILSAYKIELSVDVQALVPGWVAQEALPFPDRFAFDTLESLDQYLFETTINEVERQWRLCTVVSDLWGTAWVEALFNACVELYNFIHHAEFRHSPDLGELGPLVVLHAMADADGFLAFLLSTSGEPAEKRALRDYGSGLGWIHFLANFGMAEALRNLLDNLKVDINKPDFQGRTPLYFATICGNSSMVDFLLGRGAQATFGRDKKNNTCLHFVTSFRRSDIPRIVQRLVEAGADVDAPNSTGSTPLHKALMQTASATSNFSAAEALLRYGADPCVKDSDGEMSHYWAVALHQPEALELLLKAAQSRLSESDFLILKVNLFDHLMLVPQIDIASFAGPRFPQSLDEVIQLLLDEPTLEAYKTLPDNGGDSAFYRASGRGKLELMRSICRCFPFVDVNEGEIEYNRPAMQYAIRHNKRSVVETLLSLGANLFYQDSLGENALHVAAVYAPELLDLILELSRKDNNLEEMIEARSIHGLTPLDKAIMSGYLDTAQTLIDSGASHDQLRCLGEEGKKMTTLGHILSMPFASLEQVDFLLQFDASVIVSEDGSTVFHALAGRSQNIRDEGSSSDPNK
jgi:ankyrin repeat protein